MLLPTVVDTPESGLIAQLMWPGLYLAYTPIAMLLVAAIAWGPTVLSPAFEHRWARVLGDSSYSFYLLQGSLLYIVAATWAPSPTTWWFSTLGVLVLIVLSILSARWIEQPARRLLRGRTAQASAPALARTRPDPSVSGAEETDMAANANALAYIDGGMRSVPGWFDDTEARAFLAADRTQRAAGTSGDLLEIGAYLGKSAILLGYLVRPGEQLVVADLFEDEATDAENSHEMARHYESFTLERFNRNFARFHDWLPVVLRGPSAETVSTLPGGSCRIVHVDGSHTFEAVRADIAQARRLLAPGGLVILDDLFAVHAPGVQAAVWEAVSEGLVPVAIGLKMYGTWTPENFDRDEFSRELGALDGVVVAGTHRILGYDVIELVRDPSWRLPSRFRRGVALLTPPAVPQLTAAAQRRLNRAAL